MISSCRQGEHGMEYMVDGKYVHFSKLNLTDILAYWHAIYPKMAEHRHFINEEMKNIHKQKLDLISVVEHLEIENVMLLDQVKRYQSERSRLNK